MKIKHLPVKFKTEGDDLKEGEFLVYPSTFTREPDSYGDVVAPGAFLAGIERRKGSGAALPGLFGHRMDDPHMYVATALEEGEDEHGWWVKGVFDLGEPTADKVYRLVKSGRINELSFAFDVEDEGQVELGDGRKANELRALDVFEYSFVPVGANRDTSIVAVKSAAHAMLDGLKAGRVLSSKNQDALREAIAAIEDTAESLKAVLAQAEQDDPPNDPDKNGKDQAPAGGKSEATFDSDTEMWAHELALISHATI